MRGRIAYGICILAVVFLLTVPAWAQESSPTDEIVIKTTDAVMFQITANMKLNQDQINAVRRIITDHIVKVRNLQQSVEDGNIDSRAMYDRKLQLINEEDQELSHILTADQMKVLISLQENQVI